MSTPTKFSRLLWLKSLPVIGIVLLLTLQYIWLTANYNSTYKQFITEIDDALSQARQKEQTYRIPVEEIVTPGDVTIQSCGTEEIRIIRKCPTPDTLFYDNLSGQSLEAFINRAFYELREHILPLNIYCLADLFSGTLYEKEISINFDLERVNKISGEILETSAIDRKQLPTAVVETEISGTDILRANLYFSSFSIFERMNGMLTITSCLLFLALICFCVHWYFIQKKKITNPLIPIDSTPVLPEENNFISDSKPENSFQIGCFKFNPDKNELQGTNDLFQLNKKENSILHELCAHNGNVVERNYLLEKYWGNNGFIYSRSLDTYIANLRKYLKEDDSVQIVTIKGLGYKLVSG